MDIKIDLFIYHFSVMGFCPDSETKPDLLCRRQKAQKDYSILLLCCVNLITSMPQDKAVHCGKSFFNKSHYAGSMLPKLRPQTPHTEMELHVKIWNSPRLLFDGSAGQGTYHIPAIMWMFLFSSQHSSVTTAWEVTQKEKKHDLFVHPRMIVLVSFAHALTCICLQPCTAKVNGISSVVL